MNLTLFPFGYRPIPSAKVDALADSIGVITLYGKHSLDLGRKDNVRRQARLREIAIRTVKQQLLRYGIFEGVIQVRNKYYLVSFSSIAELNNYLADKPEVKFYEKIDALTR